MSIVKSAQLPDVGRCEGGLPMATFERLEPYVGKPTSTVLMGLRSGKGLGYQTAASTRLISSFLPANRDGTGAISPAMRVSEIIYVAL